jgi:spore coat protein CotH
MHRRARNVEREADAGSVRDARVVDPGAVIPEPDDTATYLFDQTALRTYNIMIDPNDLATIDADPAAEEYVPARLEFEGRSYGPLAVRYKGSVGGFRPPCTSGMVMLMGSNARSRGPKTGKCSMKVDFNRVDPDARFFGLKKLNFHAMHRDPSMLRDRLGYAMFRESGIAAPRAMHARLEINGQLEGLYIVVEQVDGRFTDSRFTDDGDGNLYKEIWPNHDMAESYLAALETHADDNPSVDKMVRFAADVASSPDASMRWLDEQYIMNYIAVDRVIVNDDGAFHWYCGFNHNYYWYESERADRFWLIPWDLDASFNPGTSFVHIAAPWNMPATDCTMCRGQRPAICDPLTADWAMEHDPYERAVDTFLEGPFAEENVDSKLAAWSEQIDATIHEAAGIRSAPSYEEWQTSLEALRNIITNARAHRGWDYDMPITMPPSP